LKQDILEEAQQTNEYKEARNAKRKKREVSQKELADILASKGFNETKIETIVLGNDTENATEVLKAKLEILVKNKTLKNYP
jgi:SOS response regulatory protein OraA/RecX